MWYVRLFMQSYTLKLYEIYCKWTNITITFLRTYSFIWYTMEEEKYLFMCNTEFLNHIYVVLYINWTVRAYLSRLRLWKRHFSEFLCFISFRKTCVNYEYCLRCLAYILVILFYYNILIFCQQQFAQITLFNKLE